MTSEEWLPLMQGVLMGLVLPIDWVVRRLKRPERHRVDPIEPPLPSHIGGYRTNPRPQPIVPRRAKWWRLAWWWVRGGTRRLELALERRSLRGEPVMWSERARIARLTGWDRIRAEFWLDAARAAERAEQASTLHKETTQ